MEMTCTYMYMCMQEFAVYSLLNLLLCFVSSLEEVQYRTYSPSDLPPRRASDINDSRRLGRDSSLEIVMLEQ